MPNLFNVGNASVVDKINLVRHLAGPSGQFTGFLNRKEGNFYLVKNCDDQNMEVERTKLENEVKAPLIAFGTAPNWDCDDVLKIYLRGKDKGLTDPLLDDLLKHIQKALSIGFGQGFGEEYTPFDLSKLENTRVQASTSYAMAQLSLGFPSGQTATKSSVVLEPAKPVLRQVESKPSTQAKSMTIPKGFICPITKKPMVDPVIYDDNYSYERTALENQLRKGGEAIAEVLRPNISLRLAIEEFRAEHPELFEQVQQTQGPRFGSFG